MYFGFKKRRICVKEQQILEMLDPFVPILSECLRSSHVEVRNIYLRFMKLVVVSRLISRFVFLSLVDLILLKNFEISSQSWTSVVQKV